MATLTRSTGVLLSVFIAYFLGNKFLVRLFLSEYRSALKVVFTILVCVIIMFAPLIIIVYWKPYQLHCSLRFERNWQGPIPEWCYDKLPNVYTYIQLKYWENRFLGFLYRGPENFLVAIPTNVLYLTMTYRVASSHTSAFFTLGIFGKKTENKEDLAEKKDVLTSEASIPHIWYMAI